MHNLSEELYEQKRNQLQPWLTSNWKNNAEQIVVRTLLVNKANATISDESYIATDANILPQNSI
ncbi:hypothetical protein [Aeromonas caviae]|uniref:hypothetical protein n=1 Tax=Aeromonas caviae TaxID=648 RepID=UPI003014BFDE